MALPPTASAKNHVENPLVALIQIFHVCIDDTVYDWLGPATNQDVGTARAGRLNEGLRSEVAQSRLTEVFLR
jgi:hypothetical protein